MAAPAAATNPSEAEERQYLEEIKGRLDRALERIDARVRGYADDVQEQKTYAWESRADMDHAEKVSARESIEQAVLTADAALGKKKRIQKLMGSPYFGRLDFAECGAGPSCPIYIGIHSFFDDESKENLIFDWRAPIASMFYDYETGEARYEAPSGKVEGTISLKRQYRIRQGRMEFMLESDLNIMDDVLQEELSRTSDSKMQNIVATIQRDQNAIIRDADSQVLVIQGAAGSGKTSIALHRIAYLLYRFKETLTSNDILIISPNRVFADYISNVLPELGEEEIAQTDMESLAEELLDHQYRFETFFEQAERLLTKNDEAHQRRIQAKASREFLKQLDRYVSHAQNALFSAEDLWLGRRLIPAWFIEECYEKNRGLPATERVNRMAAAVEQQVAFHYQHNLLPEERTELKTALKGMHRHKTLRTLYKEFFEWLGEPELFRPAKNSKLEYADVFPLIYLKMRLEGVRNGYKAVKHLLVDEMQDYTPVQYAVLAKLFPCKKTILGDANQSINPFGSSTSDEIREVFLQAWCAKLSKSYRSSYEIVRFAQRIAPDAEVDPVERHGEEPEVVRLPSSKAETARVVELIEDFKESDHRTQGIICKTQKQAKALHDAITQQGHEAHLLTSHSTAFTRGVVVCTAHTAKGLEFDRVIVPEATDRNFATGMDRNLLYVACTRAMHKLTLTHTGKPTPFVQPQ